MIDKVLDHLAGFRKPVLPLIVNPIPIFEAQLPEALSFSLRNSKGVDSSAKIETGAEITPGQALGDDNGSPVLPSPVKGKVTAVTRVPDIRGNLVVEAVIIKPDAQPFGVAFDKIDPASASTAELCKRIEEAGIVTNAANPTPLLEVIGAETETTIETVIILAADREPETAAQLQVFKERAGELAEAAGVIRNISGAQRLVLAVTAPMADEASGAAVSAGMELLPLPARYPQSLEPLVIHHCHAGPEARVITIETAMAALDAIRDGKVQTHKIVTVIGVEGKALGNYRVPLGTRLRDLIAMAGLATKEKDKVVAGGPMRGIAQFSLDAAVDAGMDALTFIPGEKVLEWSDEPCINCGACVSVCPAKLQIQLIGRYAEFELFDEAERLGLFSCIECGLCATVCTGNRPLLQFIRLAKRELTAKADGTEVTDSENSENSPAASENTESENA